MIDTFKTLLEYVFTALMFLTGLVSAYYWLQYVMVDQGPYYMSRGLTWAFFTLLFLGALVVVEEYGGQTTNPT